MSFCLSVCLSVCSFVDREICEVIRYVTAPGGGLSYRLRYTCLLQTWLFGAQLVMSSMTTQCKCHGVSGSCLMKTCWRSLADMRTVAEQIYQNYVVAVEIRSRRVPGSKQRRLFPVAHTGRTNFSEDDLLFYTQSPDYCHLEPLLGSSGTTNRYVSATLHVVF